MMDNNILDDYLRAYGSETDILPSDKFRQKILAIADRKRVGEKFSVHPALDFAHWFDLKLPRAVGWVLTCILGLYLGLPSSERSPVQEGYYLYDQAQILLYEDLTAEDAQ